MDKNIKKELSRIAKNPSSGIKNAENQVYATVQSVFVVNALISEVKKLKNDLQNYNSGSKETNRRMLYLTISLGVVASFQLFIAYGQFRLGEVQIEAAREQAGTQNAIWSYEKMRNDRLEVRDNNWRREDLEYQGRLPLNSSSNIRP